jgi:TolB-like protein
MPDRETPLIDRLASALADRYRIERELGGESLLTGRIQRSADQVRINVSLVSATDGAVRCAEKYDRPLTNVFAVRRCLAGEVRGLVTVFGR